MHELRFSVGRIPKVNRDDWGTCFVVQPGTLVVTCEHVLQDAVRRHGRVAIDIASPTVNGLGSPSKRIWADVLHADPVRDLAILELSNPPVWLRPLSLFLDAACLQGRRISSYGYPERQPEYGAPADGDILAESLRGDTDQPALVLRSSELTGGFSGAPIVDELSGLVVGIMSDTLKADARGRYASHAWAIPAAALTLLMPGIICGEHPLAAELRRVAVERVPGMVDFGLHQVADLQPMSLSLSLEEDPQKVSLNANEVIDLALRNARCVLVCGPGGAGKSTLLRSIYAPLLATASPNGELVTTPVYFTARNWHGTRGGSDVERLVQAIQAQNQVRYPRERLASELALLTNSKARRLVFLIDAFDEIADSAERMEALKDVRDLAASLAPHHVVIVSSRRVEELVVLHSAKALWVNVEPVQHDSVKSYFSAALGEIEGSNLARQFSHVEGVAATGSPLLAAMALSIALKGEELPRSVVQVFDTYLGRHSQRGKRRQSFSYAELSDDEVYLALQELAFRSIGQDLNFGSATKILQQANWNTPALFGGERTPQLAGHRFEALLESHFALVRDGDSLSWAHLSLRDYFVARRLAPEASADSLLWRSYVTKWSDSNWRAAIRFAILMASEGSEITQDLIRPIPPFDGSEANDDSLAFLTECVEAGGHFAGNALIDLVDVAVVLGVHQRVQYGSCESLFMSSKHPFEQLLRLRAATPHATERILDLLNVGKLSTNSRERLAKELLT